MDNQRIPDASRRRVNELVIKDRLAFCGLIGKLRSLKSRSPRKTSSGSYLPIGQEEKMSIAGSVTVILRTQAFRFSVELAEGVFLGKLEFSLRSSDLVGDTLSSSIPG